MLADLVEGLSQARQPDSPVAARCTDNHRFGREITALAEAVRAGDADRALEALLRRRAVPTSSCSTPSDAAALAALRARLVAHALRLREARRRPATPDGAVAALDEHRLLCAHRDGPCGVGHWNRARRARARRAHRAADRRRPGPGVVRRSAAAAHQQRLRPRPLQRRHRRRRRRRPAACAPRSPAPPGSATSPPRGSTDVETMHAMTVHKSQGSQAAEVTVLLPARRLAAADPRALLHRDHPGRGEGDAWSRTEDAVRAGGRARPSAPPGAAASPAVSPTGRKAKPERHAACRLESWACCCCAWSCPTCPGSLGRLASAIGAAGGDIEAIEIVEKRLDGTAVDDVLLDMVDGAMPDSVVSACNAVEGVRVLWISRYLAGRQPLPRPRGRGVADRRPRDRARPAGRGCCRSRSAASGRPGSAARRRWCARQRGRAHRHALKPGHGLARQTWGDDLVAIAPGATRGSWPSAAAAGRSSSTPSWPGWHLVGLAASIAGGGEGSAVAAARITGGRDPALVGRCNSLTSDRSHPSTGVGADAVGSVRARAGRPGSRGRSASGTRRTSARWRRSSPTTPRAPRR